MTSELLGLGLMFRDLSDNPDGEEDIDNLASEDMDGEGDDDDDDDGEEDEEF